VKLNDATTLYVQLVQAQGSVGANVAAVLRMFARSVGGERELDSIKSEEVRTFLDGKGPLTRYWHRKHSALLGFFRFAFARALVARIPLPASTPRCRQTFQPYVYTDDDFARLVAAIDGLRVTHIEPRTLRTLLLLLFGTGLRLSEALKVSTKHRYPLYQCLQPHYNLCERADYEKNLEPVCKENRLGVIPYFSLAAGFLTGKYRSEADLSKSPRGAGLKKYLNERGLRILGALDTVAKQSSSTPAAVALAWLLARPSVTAPIASATNLEQLHTLLSATRLELDRTAIELLNRASE